MKEKAIRLKRDVTQESFDMLSLLLQFDPEKRPSVQEVLNHSLFSKFHFDISRPLNQDELNLLKENYLKNSPSGRYILPEFIQKD